MESYIQEAWLNFSRLVYWMASTVILQVNGQPVTFLGLLVVISIFNIVVWVFYKLWNIGMSED